MEKLEKPKIAMLWGQSYNLYESNESYSRAIEELGGIAIGIGYDNVIEDLKNIDPDGILLVGGSFPSPASWYGEVGNEIINERTMAYLDMVAFAKEHKLPTLGICAGMQIIAHTEGALLIKEVEYHKAISKKAAHKILLNHNSLFYKIMSSSTNSTPAVICNNIWVNSRHKEAVDLKNLGDCIAVALCAEDGIVEAIEVKNPWHDFVIGVQWHPEDLAIENDTASMKLFEAFINACL